LATSSLPIVAPAPGLFSTRLIAEALGQVLRDQAHRAVDRTPGENGTTTRTGREG
jgi:hypothetical protein